MFSKLPNNLIIDLEHNLRYYDSMSLTIGKQSESKIAEDFSEILNALTAQYKAKGRTDYDYITIDHSSVLDSILSHLALRKLKKDGAKKHQLLEAQLVKIDSSIEKLTISDFDNLPFGKAASYTVAMLDFIVKSFSKLANKTFILVGHPKQSDIKVENSSMAISNLDMTGKRPAQLFKMIDVALGLKIVTSSDNGDKHSKLITYLLPDVNGSSTTRFDMYRRQLTINDFLINPDNTIREKTFMLENLFPN